MNNLGVTAQQIMKRDLTAVMPDDTIEDAVQVLTSHMISGVPVIDSAWRIVGYLSEIDILRSAMPSYIEILAQDTFLYHEHEVLIEKFAGIRNRPVSEYMQNQYHSVQTTSNILNAADIILRYRLRRLPVLEGQILAGIIDRSDLCRYLMKADVSA